MSDWRRHCVVLGITALALLLIAYHAHPEGVSQGAEESPTALRAETPEALSPRTPRTGGEAEQFRWVFMGVRFYDDSKTEAAISKVAEWRAWGINGVILANAETLWLGLLSPAYEETYKENLARFVAACREGEDPIEVVPYLAVPSGANALLAHDPNLAAGYKVEKALFTAEKGVATLTPDPAVSLENGGFEEVGSDGKFAGWDGQDSPCQAVCPDRETMYRGERSDEQSEQSARLNGAEGLCRLWQCVDVEPHRYYHISVYLKTEGLAPTSSFHLQVAGLEGAEVRWLAWNEFEPEATQDWTPTETVFNSRDYKTVRVYFGLWKATGGQAWLDEAQIEEIGLVNVLRREGCPLTVTSEDGKTTYVEKFDFKYVQDPDLGKWDPLYHDPPGIEILNPKMPDRLRVSFYHPMVVYKSLCCCLTEPKVYTVFEGAVNKLEEWAEYTPRYYMLGINELRTGASCAGCKATGRTAGQLLSQSINRFLLSVRKISPEVEKVLVWGDMFDPNHNAHDDYYLVDGPLAGSWEGLDEDVIVVPWYSPIRDCSLGFFACRGREHIGSVYADGAASPGEMRRRTLEWLTSMTSESGKHGLGLIYTTWKGQHQYVEAFAGVFGGG